MQFWYNNIGWCLKVSDENDKYKEKYSKYGIHKGDRGIIASNKATKNKILVDFGKEAEDFDGFISVDFEDVKKVE